MNGKRYLTGEYLKYYEEFSGSDVNGSATNFKSEVETLTQEFSNIKNVIVNWSGEGALALSNTAMTSIFNKFDVIIFYIHKFALKMQIFIHYNCTNFYLQSQCFYRNIICEFLVNLFI